MTDKRTLNKAVAFNRESPDDAELIEHIKRKTNFSSYVKRLILKDILERRWSKEHDR